MKGIYHRMQESKVHTLGKFTQEDLDTLVENLKIAEKENEEYKIKRLKELEDNRKALVKRSKKLGKEIPFELAWHYYLSYPKTYTGSEFLEKYKEWLNE